jgi:hypothetical protein
MHGAMAFFVFVFVACQIVVIGISGGGMAATVLTAPVSANGTILNVASTANFLGASGSHPGYLVVTGSGREVVSYTGLTSTSITGCARGVADPQTGEQYEACPHTTGSKVMTTNVGALDSFVGYNVGSAQGTTGSISVVIASGLAILRNLPRMLAWDYPWFNNQTAILRLLLFCLSAGFVWALFMTFLQLAQGILNLFT